MNYLDFEIEISPGVGREYPVAIVRSPAGEARETMKFPFDELALKDRLKNLQIALLRSGGKRRSPSPEERTVQEFGEALFNALLTGELRSRYDVSQREAAQKGAGLRFKLRIQSPELAALPWEFLYDSRQAEYVCLSRSTPVVRYLELPQIIQPFAVTPPLRILGMMISPSDLQPLNLVNEQRRMEEATKDLRKNGLVELTWLEGKTWRDLQKAMRGGPWHIFHFIGHGKFDRNAGEGLIFLEDEEGASQRLSATQLGRLLADHHSLRLALLNACEGAKSSERDIFSSTGAILVRRGLLAVLAMQYEITDRAAVEFSRSFYEALAESMPVDAAVVEARKAISFAVNNTMEWGTPVLYMRAPDGKVFDIDSAQVVTPRPPTITPLPKETEEEKLYAKFKNEGDALFSQGKYVEAKLKYANALAQRPDDSYLDDRINLCNQKMAEQKATAERAELYAKYKEEGDAAFAQGEYEQAKSLYEQALSLKSGDQYVSKRIQACDKLLAKSGPADIVLVQAGIFKMGSENGEADEKPVHEVYVDAFYMDAKEVTVEKFKRFIDATGYKTEAEKEGWSWAWNGKEWEKRNGVNWRHDPKGELAGNNYPVIHVSWNDATEYGKWLSRKTGAKYRLPTEAEWEYAAIGGHKAPYEGGTGSAHIGKHQYAGSDNLNEVGWYYENSNGGTHPVAKKKPNELGLYDMSGNVYEWCQDWYDEKYYETCKQQGVVKNPKGPETGSGRVLRGGFWRNDAQFCRSAGRSFGDPDIRYGIIGFRLVFVP